MKLLHTADIHLDSPLRGLARYEGAPEAELRLASRAALGNLVRLALEEAVDAVLIAGDVFDGEWPDYSTGIHFVHHLHALREAGIPVVMVSGNHDASSRVSRSLTYPEGVHVLPVDAPGTVVLEPLGLAVHGQGYATAAVVDDLSAGYPAPRGGLVNVGLLHTSADGRPGHERYAPCDPRRLAAHGYDYWALGHIHEREVVVADPPVVFPGCLQGRHAKEAGPKGATIVHADPGGGVRLEERVLDQVRWHVAEVDVSGAGSMDDVQAAVSRALRGAVDGAGERLVAVRVVLRGPSPVHGELARDADRVRSEVLTTADEVAGDQLWVEKVACRTRPVAELPADGDDAHAALLRGIRGAAEGEALDELAAALEPLAAKLPAELRRTWDPTAAATIAELVADVERLLPPRLLETA